MPSFTQYWTSWREAARAAPFLLLDCAGIEAGAAGLPRELLSRLECLFTGDLAEELADVAPYLGQFAGYDEAAGRAVDDLLRRHLAILVLPQDGPAPVGFSALHRHFRKNNVVYGPGGNPLFFRYYDPRALLQVLPVFDRKQLDAFFGPVETLVLYGAENNLLRCYRNAGELTFAT